MLSYLKGKSIHNDHLLVGFEGSDDAAVWQVSDDLAIVLNVDYFTPIIDDPYDFGRIAAANAFSDIYAMGATPRFAMNLLAFPKLLGTQTAGKVLQGGAYIATQAHACVAGGHTIEVKEPAYGMCVVGTCHPDDLLLNSGAQPGDVLMLSKPLGSGIITSGLKSNCLSDRALHDAIEHMATLNKNAAEIAHEFHAHAMTDVTGFGLIGHAHEMCTGTHTSFEISYSALEFMDEVKSLVRQDKHPGKTASIAAWADAFSHIDTLDDLDEQQARMLLNDPQTSGGLLFCVEEKYADACEEKLKRMCGMTHPRIGRVIDDASEHIHICA